MKIALPSNDGTTVSAHFGRSRGFIIFETDNHHILKEEYRENNVTGHAQGHHHDHDHDHHHGQGNENHTHSHAGILGVLSDCEVVIAGGMGHRLYTDLMAAGKKVYVTRENDARKAAELLLKDDLDHNPEVCCHH